MITAVDTNVLSDVFRRDPQYYESSSDALRAAIFEGAIVACCVVWAEISGAFPNRSEAESAMDRLSIGYDSLGREASLKCGEAWRTYRQSGGPRQRVIADFMIAAHALNKSDRLLTRDRGFYRTYFPELILAGNGSKNKDSPPRT